MHNIYPWEYFLYGRKLFFRNENFILSTPNQNLDSPKAGGNSVSDFRNNILPPFLAERFPKTTVFMSGGGKRK